MELHRQTCQKCGSTELIDIIARAVGESDKVYVQCAKCEALVARYVIAQGGYFHHGKGFESYLRSLNRGGHYESTKEMVGGFEELNQKIEAEFAGILKELIERHDKEKKS